MLLHSPCGASAGAPREAHAYPGTQHGCQINSTPRCDEAAAELAWERMIASFCAHPS
ncbi:MAG: dienelactone hydrolase family protein [Betaproteobacteria bacterium]|nr:MAG: dienelactone hydrolase family protein [Betaproteobacteria bacterium]